MKVGFIGLGMMGTAMATRLLEEGVDLVVYNRTTSKAQTIRARYGGRVEIVTSPREVAEKISIFFTMVSNDEAIREIAFPEERGVMSALQSQHYWIDSSTISPIISRQLDKTVSEKGAVRLEAPVSGSVDVAENGELVMYVGGSQKALDDVGEVLKHVTSRIEYVGEVGQALALKLAINLNIAVQLEGFVEGMMIAENAGLEKERAVELMLNSVVASPMLKYRVPFAINPPKEPWFTMELMLKDLNLALDEAKEENTPLPVTGTTANLLRAAVSSQMGKEEVAVLINFMRDFAQHRPSEK